MIYKTRSLPKSNFNWRWLLKRQGFNIPHGSANLADNHIWANFLFHISNPGFYFIGNMRYNLDRLAKYSPRRSFSKTAW